MLCICGGIIELWMVISAGVLVVFPFLAKLYKRRNTLGESKDCCKKD